MDSRIYSVYAPILLISCNEWYIVYILYIYTCISNTYTKSMDSNYEGLYPNWFLNYIKSIFHFPSNFKQT